MEQKILKTIAAASLVYIVFGSWFDIWGKTSAMPRSVVQISDRHFRQNFFFPTSVSPQFVPGPSPVVSKSGNSFSLSERKPNRARVCSLPISDLCFVQQYLFDLLSFSCFSLSFCFFFTLSLSLSLALLLATTFISLCLTFPLSLCPPPPPLLIIPNMRTRHVVNGKEQKNSFFLHPSTCSKPTLRQCFFSQSVSTYYQLHVLPYFGWPESYSFCVPISLFPRMCRSLCRRYEVMLLHTKRMAS